MTKFKMTVFFTVLLAIFPLFSGLTVLEANERQNIFGNVADYLSRIYGIDDNTGLTAFPILNIPFGGRAEGMIAFSAIADDVSFIGVNPAGSSMLQRSELAFFHNNWIANANIEGAAFATRIGNLGLGAGARVLHMPFTEYNIYGERVSGGHYAEGVVILNASYNFLSGFYFYGLSLGINLKGAFRIMPDFTGDFDNIISGSGLSQSAVMGMADIGLLTRFNFLKFFTARERNASAALVIRNLGPPSMGEPLPTSISLGFSYKPIRPLTFGFDFTHPINLVNPSLSELPYGAVGLSLNVTNFFSMRGGFLFRAGSSRVSIGSAISFRNIAIDINYTLDLLTQLQPLNRVSLGVRFNLGDGGRQQLSSRVDDLYILGLEAFSRGNIEDARLLWEEALRLNPRFEPAREGLVMIEDREELLRRIEDLYRLGF